MLDSAIRTISIARRSPIAAAAHFEKKVQIWNLANAALVSELDTVFQFGGHRLTLSPTGEYCVAARFRAGQNGGVVCYETRSGRKIWHRADLRRVQGVRFSAANEAIWCQVEGQAVLSLDINTGLTIGSLRTICDVFDSPFTQHVLQEPRGRDRGLAIVGSTTLLVPRSTCAILDATFSPDALCLSEAGGPVRCVNSPPPNRRWLRVSAVSRIDRPCGRLRRLASVFGFRSFGFGILVRQPSSLRAVQLRPVVFQPVTPYPSPEGEGFTDPLLGTLKTLTLVATRALCQGNRFI